MPNMEKNIIVSEVWLCCNKTPIKAIKPDKDTIIIIVVVFLSFSLFINWKWIWVLSGLNGDLPESIRRQTTEIRSINGIAKIHSAVTGLINAYSPCEESINSHAIPRPINKEPESPIKTLLFEIFIKKKSNLFKNINDKSHMYFVHSFEFLPNEEQYVTSTINYSKEIVSSLEKDNIFGTQFHPEKSDKDGLKIIENFITL